MRRAASTLAAVVIIGIFFWVRWNGNSLEEIKRELFEIAKMNMDEFNQKASAWVNGTTKK